MAARDDYPFGDLTASRTNTIMPIGRWKEMCDEIDHLRQVTLRIAEAFDDNSDDDGQWEGADICDAVAAILVREGAFLRCPVHGVYAASKDECPYKDEEEPDCK